MTVMRRPVVGDTAVSPHGSPPAWPVGARGPQTSPPVPAGRGLPYLSWDVRVTRPVHVRSGLRLAGKDGGERGWGTWCRWGVDEPVVVGADRLGRLARPCPSGGAGACLGNLAAFSGRASSAKTARGGAAAPRGAVSARWAAAWRHLSPGQGSWRALRGVACLPSGVVRRPRAGDLRPMTGPSALTARAESSCNWLVGGR